MNVDRKYKILAVNPTTGGIHTEDDSILFLAKDLAVVPMLVKYFEACTVLGCDEHHLKSIKLLTERVREFQLTHISKVPDTTPEENTVHADE